MENVEEEKKPKVRRCVTTKIEAHSRMSVKIKDNFFTFEFIEERTVPADMSEDELAYERECLWDTINDEVDKQVELAVGMMKKSR